MLTVTFKAKLQQMLNPDKTPAYMFVKVPARPGRQHCNMCEFRTHKQFRDFANSDVFPSMLIRALSNIGVKPGSLLRLDKAPEHVSIDTSGFLAVVTINLE